MSEDGEVLLPEGGEGPDEATLSEARSQGWVPQDQWHGKPNDWVDAETYVRRGREILPIVRKALSEERQKNQALMDKLEAQGATIVEMREYFAKLEKRANENVLAQLKAQKRIAAEAGDHAQVAELDDQIDAVKEQGSAVPEVKFKQGQGTQAPQELPEVKAWMSQNPWYSDSNPRLVKFANGAALAIRQAAAAQGRQVSPSEVLDQVAQEVQETFPDFFKVPSTPFEGGGTQSGSTRQSSSSGGKGKGFGSLPAEAKAQFERFYKSGYYVQPGTKKPMDKEAAQKEYFSNYEA